MSIVFIVGMIVLELWALGNIALWWTRRNRLEPRGQYYRRQMDAMWNVVNVLIAVYALGVLLAGVDSERLNDIARVVAINVFADIGYAVAGAVLMYRFRHRWLRVSAYGRSIIVQGSFLFVLDSLMIAGWLLTAS